MFYVVDVHYVGGLVERGLAQGPNKCTCKDINHNNHWIIPEGTFQAAGEVEEVTLVKLIDDLDTIPTKTTLLDITMLNWDILQRPDYKWITPDDQTPADFRELE